MKQSSQMEDFLIDTSVHNYTSIGDQRTQRVTSDNMVVLGDTNFVGQVQSILLMELVFPWRCILSTLRPFTQILRMLWKREHLIVWQWLGCSSRYVNICLRCKMKLACFVKGFRVSKSWNRSSTSLSTESQDHKHRGDRQSFSFGKPSLGCWYE